MRKQQISASVFAQSFGCTVGVCLKVRSHLFKISNYFFLIEKENRIFLLYYNEKSSTHALDFRR